MASVTEALNFKLNLNSHMCLVAAILDSTILKHLLSEPVIKYLIISSFHILGTHCLLDTLLGTLHKLSHQLFTASI